MKSTEYGWLIFCMIIGGIAECSNKSDQMKELQIIADSCKSQNMVIDAEKRKCVKP